jgi:hypothetical protein
MITITHNRATFTVKPENAEPTRELLALIDKSKGRKGAKLPRPRKEAKFDSMKRQYPPFYPGMTTAEYVSDYMGRNGHVHLAPVDYTHADRPAPMLDPSIPEVMEEPCEQ